MQQQVLLILGGKSGEHEVSVKSARSIEKHIDPSLYQTHCLGITQDGYWTYGQTVADITDGNQVLAPNAVVGLPDGIQAKTFSITTAGITQTIPTDVVFPVIHGTNGEDGTLQGLLELANLPYVGSGVLGSAVSMDKLMQKSLCQLHGLPQTKYLGLDHQQWLTKPESVIKTISEQLTYPVFIKPANLGSSVGISKVKSESELAEAVTTAFKFDTKVLVEQGVENMLEIEVGILGNDNPHASVCGSIQPHTEFYDYETKYVTDDITTQIPAQIPDPIAQQIQSAAIQAFKLLNCQGLARVDFFYQAETNSIFLNELNTLPGFANISQYPKLWEASGLNYTDLISKLLQLATEKWASKQKLQYTYHD